MLYKVLKSGKIKLGIELYKKVKREELLRSDGVPVSREKKGVAKRE